MIAFTKLLVVFVSAFHFGFTFEHSFSSEWIQHKSKYNLTFKPEEEPHRYEIFRENMEFIAEHNSKNLSTTLEMNKLGHLATHEISKGLKTSPHFIHTEPAPSQIKNPLPVRKQIDWRKFGVVTNVKNQGQCGSCYAFSAIAAIESAFAIRTGEKVRLSEQEIIDCSSYYQNRGCNGGSMNNVFNYCKDHGVSLEINYTYEAKQGECRAKNPNKEHRLLGFSNIKRGDENDLVRAISFIGPVSIAMDANHKEFFFYKSGVLKIANCSSTNVDHGLLAVGYDLEEDQPYIIVKNSWGSDWGDKGYVKVALFASNMCGIASFASYPVPNP